MRSDPRTGTPIALFIAVFFVAVAAFSPTLSHGFVYDDHRFFEANAALREWSVLWRAFSDPAVQTADGTHAGLWRPLRTLSFAFDVGVLGGAAWWAHLHNVLLHGAGSVLVAALLRRTGLGTRSVFVGALVYALHPVQVECVAWISSRGDVLAAALLWAALLLQRPGNAWSSWALGAAALLAKEQALVWPVFAFLFALLAHEGMRAALRRAVVPAVVTVAFVALRHAILSEPFQQGGVGDGGPGFVELGAMLAHQVWFSVLPVGAVFDWQMPPPPALVGALALLPFGLLWWPATRVPAAWFLAALVPTLFVQAVIPLNIRTADRFLLFALPAAALLVARGVERVPRVVPSAGIALACLATLTISGERVWASDSALWSETAERVPGHWRAESWLGLAATRDGDVDAAVVHMRRAVEALPQDAKTWFRLGEAVELQAARADGTDAVTLTRAARDAYSAAANRFPRGRQENAALFGPMASLRAIKLTLVLGDVETVRDVLVSILERPGPSIPAWGVEGWNRDVEELAARVEKDIDAERSEPLAPRIRAWRVRP